MFVYEQIYFVWLSDKDLPPVNDPFENIYHHTSNRDIVKVFSSGVNERPSTGILKLFFSFGLNN